MALNCPSGNSMMKSSAAFDPADTASGGAQTCLTYTASDLGTSSYYTYFNGDDVNNLRKFNILNGKTGGTVTNEDNASICISKCNGNANCPFAVFNYPSSNSPSVACTLAKVPTTKTATLYFQIGTNAPTPTIQSTSSTSSTTSTTDQTTSSTSSTLQSTTTNGSSTSKSTTSFGPASSSSGSVSPSNTSGNDGNGGNGTSSGGNSSLQNGLIAASAVTLFVIVAAVVFFAVQKAKKRKTAAERDAVFSLPWRQSRGGVGLSSAAGSVNGTLPKSGSSYPPNLYNTNGSSSATVAPVAAAAPAAPQFSVEQYLAVGWTMEQLREHHPEFFVGENQSVAGGESVVGAM
ncbi:hypothetical protein HDU76_001240 [Blyttiomyces sp. JEL0837]|nr:hypothetical protein HDU76_001240 [Blyttiomyces sp. JEL0837]